MSDTREASWYEIALTHSQIVKIFVVLLLCLVGAFFSGVWIGRDAAASIDRGGELVTLAQVPGEDGEGREVAQLKFFSEDDVVPTGNGAKSADSAQPAIDPGAGSTLMEDLTAGAQSQGEASRGVESVPARGTPDAPVAVTRESGPATSQRAASQTIGPEGAGDLVVQVFSSNDASQAKKVLGRLAQGGHPAYLSPVDVGGRTMYRVRIGPYTERSAAERAATTVRRDFKLDTWITSKST